MGRPLQVLGLLLMLLGFGGLIASGTPGGLLALADPCVPDKVPPAPEQPQNAQAVQATARPSAQPAKQLESYPVFAETDSLATATPSPTPEPTAAPLAASPAPSGTNLSPCPTHRHHLFGEGPITVSGTGGLGFGLRRASAQYGGQAATAQQNDDSNLSMALHLGRRTDRTSISLDESFGVTNATTGSQFNVSQLNLVYSTPQYFVGYGIVSSPTDTQLSNAVFNRGITVGVPHGRDETDLILGKTLGTSGESFGVIGLRHSAAYPRGLLFSQTLYLSQGDQSGGRNTTLDLSLGRYKSGATYRAEVAFSNSRAIPGVPDGTQLAYALHADYLGSTSSTSIGYFTIPVGYVTTGDVAVSQKNFSFTHRRNVFTRAQLTFDYGALTQAQSGISTFTQHETADLNAPIGNVINTQTLVNLAQSSSEGVVTNERDAGLTLSEQLKTLGLTQTVQATQQTSNEGAPIDQTQLSFGLTHPFLRGFINAEAATTRIFGSGSSSTQSERSIGITEPLGRKAQVGFSLDSLRLSVGDGTTASTNQLTQTFSFLRRLSPVVGVRLSYNVTHQSGAFGGTARYLTVDIAGPLAFGGAARYSGRPNPNLPAIVDGHVYLQNEASSYGLTGNRGIGNVLVTLDGGLTQRTDASGSYEFRFVKPGTHILTISTGTLPPGVIPDSATQSFTVQGGQSINIDFSAGLFAGVQGRVITKHGDTVIPVGGIQLLVDDKQRGYTASDGSYQIGHLSPGKHTVSIVLESLPSNLSPPGSNKQDVNVATGSLTNVDWTLAGLGSIEGIVLYSADAGFGDLAGARNVYVVADPGEHAAITDEEGRFLIDNLPPGSYTMSIDQDSLPDGQAVVSGPDGAVTVAGGDAIQGITFKVGNKAKQVVMTFSGGPAAAVSANFVPDQIPPNSVTELIVTTNAKKVRTVTASGDLGTIPLHYDASRKAWTARVKIGPVANADYPMHVDVEGETSGGADTDVTVSNALHTVVAHGVPAHPSPGENVRVVARIVADVEEGDIVALEGRQQIKLPKPHGNVYAFTVKALHALPIQGIIFTKRGERIPFVIQP